MVMRNSRKLHAGLCQRGHQESKTCMS